MQKLHYKNICGMLVKENDRYSWSCPDCKEMGTSVKILKVCPYCSNDKNKAKMLVKLRSASFE